MSNSSDQPLSPSAPLAISATFRSSNRKRRSSKACSSCRTRKVRCDVLQAGRPCSKCRIDGFECVLQQRKKRCPRTARASQKESSEAAGQPPRTDAAGSARSSTVRSLSQHAMVHQVPHYHFFRHFVARGQQQLPARKEEDPRMPGESGGEGAGLSSDDVQYLRHKGAFDLPAKRVMDEFVANYFQVFHPFFPVVDKFGFLESYSTTDYEGILNGRGPSLLLLQAVLFTASASIPMSVLRDSGFSSRKLARSVLHRRTRYLYDFDFESDDVTAIQALLLMSHYYPSMVEQKHTWFWVHQAISLAQGVGLHRDAGQVPQRKLWARIWWACLVRDRLVTLGTGRPMQINSLDCSVPMLTPADLQEEGDSEDDRSVKAVFVEFVRLCQYMEGVLSLPHSVAAAEESLPEQIALCESTLTHWKDNLVPAARRGDDAAGGLRRRDLCTLYKDVLHLTYNIVIIALHQYRHVLDYNRPAGAQLPSPKVQAAAEDSTQLAVELVELDLVKFCPTICVTGILPPLIVHLLMMRASHDHPGDYPAAENFDKCINFLKQLGEIYWHASFYNDFFELAASCSQNTMATSNGVRDPLVAFLNDHMPVRQQIGKASGPQSQSTSRRRTPVGDEEDDEQVRQSERRPGSKANGQGDILASNEAGSPLLSGPRTQTVMAQMPDSERLDTEDVALLNLGSQLFEDWLDDLGCFHNIFPSA